MGLWRACAQAASAIIANRLRSGLGALAIGVAVATLLIVNVALDGIQRYAELTTARTFGADTFLIAQVASPGRVSRAQLREQLARNPPITRLEASFLQRHANGQVRYALNAQTRADVVRADRRAALVPVTGTSAALAEIRDLNIVAGRFFTVDDDQRGSQVAVIGAEEQYVSFGNLKWAARALGIPVFPLIPQLLVPGGALPLPTKYRLFFGEPMYFDGDANDDLRVSDNAFLVREAVGHLLRRGLLQRKSVFY